MQCQQHSARQYSGFYRSTEGRTLSIGQLLVIIAVNVNKADPKKIMSPPTFPLPVMESESFYNFNDLATKNSRMF